jgi:uncharacterized protein YcaQ
VATALWSSGELAIRERRNFQRTYDLAERVIPDSARAHPLPAAAGIEALVTKALDGHGWASTATIIATWRLARRRTDVTAALARLAAAGRIVPCALDGAGGGPGRPTSGWIRPEDRALAARLNRLRVRADRGVLLSPFDPVLWDRLRVRRLFGFDQMLEIFKPAGQRRYGYYCLPVLAGERLVSRVDLKAERRRGELRVVSCHYETGSSIDRKATRTALERYAAALKLELIGQRTTVAVSSRTRRSTASPRSGRSTP